MATVLVVTVGGACEPIINAIKSGNYDFIYFICSKKGSELTVDGPGNPCAVKKDRGKPSIVSQINLKPDQYNKVVLSQSEIDNLVPCYRKIKELDQIISKEFGPDANVSANYTGGTKTMSAALVLAALASGWRLYVNVGPRIDLIKVHAGDTPVFRSSADIYADHYSILAEKAASHYDYEMVVTLAEDLLTMPLSENASYKWIQIQAISRGLVAWDSFEHKRASEILAAYGQALGRHLAALKKIIEPSKGHGYESVSDLVNNADRRAAQGRYDDATARLYRAVELVAQIRLKQEHGLDTSSMKITDLPERLRPDYQHLVKEKDKVLLGLRESFLLLDKLDDSIGRFFMENDKPITDALKKRNESILAHGTVPVKESVYEDVRDRLVEFIEKAVEIGGGKLDVPQFPRTISLLGPSVDRTQ